MNETTCEALLLAIERHDGQRRKKNGTPYVLHPIRVARLAARTARALGLPDERIAPIEAVALLHDVVEDTETSLEEVAERFGARVAAVVAELTKDATLPRPEQRRKMIEGCGSMSHEARIVKLADRLDNLCECQGLDREFVARYCNETDEMLSRMAGSAPSLEEALRAEVAARRSEIARSV